MEYIRHTRLRKLQIKLMLKNAMKWNVLPAGKKAQFSCCSEDLGLHVTRYTVVDIHEPYTTARQKNTVKMEA